ncbi:MAG: asparagine synthetase B [Paracoccaceae bacterium]
MSAIVGRIDFSGKTVEEASFAASLAALAPYGVDGTAVVSGDNFWFGIQRLNLSDRAHAELAPVQLGTTTVVADAVLDNRKDLGAALGYEPAALVNLPDMQLLRHSFEKWGQTCPQHILGDYAFAVYDQETRSLFLTRDHIGTRPLYWSRRGDIVMFATDIRAIVANDDFHWPIDEQAVARHLMNPMRPQSGTFFQHIKNLPPATGLEINRTGTHENEWWSPHNVPEFRYETITEYNDNFRKLMEKVACDCTATPGNIGAHFSGGIDSFSVAAFATKAMASQARALTAGYAWSPAVSDAYPIMGKRDERHVIKELASKLGVPIRYGTSDGSNMYRYLALEIELDGIANLLDERPVLTLAKADGLRVMLSGWGGDEAYSAHGAGYLAYAIKKCQFREAQKTLRFHTAARRFRPLKTLRELFRWGIIPMLPDFLYRLFLPFDTIYDGGAFPTQAAKAIAPAPPTFGEEDIRLISDPRMFLANLLKMGHLNMRMETWAAWSSEFGFQYRYPLLDRRIIEFILGMPRHLFMEDGQNRYLARKAVEDLVPDGLMKYDPANEFLRNKSRLGCWHLLREDLSENKFADDSAWIDMESLRNAINSVPEDMERDHVPKVAKILAAIRVWKMEQRLKAHRKEHL